MSNHLNNPLSFVLKERHEVGTWLEEVNPNVVLDVEDLRWLPSGKRLSFFCNDVMYSVCAD